LVQGRERAYLGWLFKAKMLDPSAIAPADLDEYARVFSAPGAARAGFDYYRALFNEGGIARNQERGERPLTIPVMAWGASAGVGNVLLDTLRRVAADVRGGTIKPCGHYIPEEQPGTVIDQLTAFFSG
jgi:pimeloyl-ACP methyl ester carboxylesterase